MIQRSNPRPLSILCAALIAASTAAVTQAQEPDVCRKILADKAPAVVMIKFVLKMSMGRMGEQENEMEVPGTMISPDGLVICSNNRLGGFMGLLARYSKQEFSAKPSDIKTLVGDDSEGVEAEFIARDTELDLAWIRIKKPGDKKYACIDLAKPGKTAIGETILCVDRMEKYFDRVAIVGSGRIIGITRKPRELYVPTTGSVTDMGVPVFAPSGELIGLSIMQMPDEEESGVNPMSMMSRLSGMGGMGGMILPAAEVAKATQRALETAATKGPDVDEPTTKPAAAKAADKDEEK